MSLTAKRLSRVSPSWRGLDGIIHEHLLAIDDKITRSPQSWGRNHIIHNLPMVFASPGIEKADAQRAVYSAIIRSLEKRGFGVRILLENDQTVLFVDWDSGLGSEELAAMNDLIASKLILREEVQEFVRKENEAGARPAPRREPPKGEPRRRARKKQPPVGDGSRPRLTSAELAILDGR